MRGAVTDVRFPDEFHYVKNGLEDDAADSMNESIFQYKRVMWKVYRQGHMHAHLQAHAHVQTDTHLQTHAHVQTDAHSSEVSLEVCSCDYKFINNKSIDKLKSTVETVYQKLMIK